jgi:hypothetical protein
MANTYNGWKNRSTWNVALWINNDYELYQSVKKYKEHKKELDKRVIAKGLKTKSISYRGFINFAGLTYTKTPDNIKYISTMLDYNALNKMIKEI